MPPNELLERILERIECEYEDAAEHVPYESAEGGYQWPTKTLYELLQEVGLELENKDLFNALLRDLPDQAWVCRNPYSLPEEKVLSLGWEDFADLVKHKVRYLLFPSEPADEPSEVPRPAQMLDEIGEIFAWPEILSILRSGTHLSRVRLHHPGQAPPNTLEALGPPPIDCARHSNRMSPAGMSMFYAALDADTALAETYVRLDGRPAEATIATFELIEDLTVLDLAHLPPVSSIFASDEANLARPALIFLNGFVDDFTQPVVKDGREHVEYVPSQVVTEYVRYRLPEKVGKPVHGILYQSARTTSSLLKNPQTGHCERSEAISLL